MLIERKTLTSKVARRIFVLFVISAILPLMVMAGLAFFQVSSVITRQSDQELRDQSKNYGMAVLERLQHARALLQAIDIDPTAIESLVLADSVLTPMFIGVAVQEANGSLTLLLGEKITLPESTGSSFEPASSAEAESLPTEEKDVKFYLVPNETDPESSTLAENLYFRFTSEPGNPNSKLLWAELNPAYLWGSRDELPSLTEFCVLTDTVEVVFCTQPVPPGVFDEQQFDKHRTVLRWTFGNEDYLAASRELFLKNQFAYPRLIIVAFQSASNALASLNAFTQLFPATLAVAIFLVLLLSLSQIRRSLVPLEKLKTGTIEIANRQFNSQIEVSSKDEFGELAQAFNSMSKRLSKQFQALNTMAKIDQLLLINPNYQQATAIILDHLPDILPCDVAGIVIVESRPATASVYLRKYSEPKQTTSTRLALGPSAFESLQDFTKPFFIDLQKSAFAETYLQPLIQQDVHYCWLVTIFQNTRPLGYIALGYQQRIQLEPSDLKQLSDVAGRIAVASIIWEREQELYHRAHYDALTDLANRQLLMEILNREISYSQRNQSLLGLLFIDLDHFKNINGTLGHGSGDQLLRQVADRLLNCLSEKDTVARLGGDEFNLVLPQLDSPRDASQLAEKVLETLGKVFYLEDQKHYISASIGIALHPYDGATSAELMRNADIAMYRAKHDGRGRYCFFEEQMNIVISERSQLERDLRQALDYAQFLLYFQPQLNLTTNTITGAETLLRWRHPEKGIISPADFISLAEETGLIDSIGEWVAEQAIKQLSSWHSQGLSLQHLAVNVSNQQFQNPDFITQIKDALKTYKISPQSLKLEITESWFLDKEALLNSNLDLLHQSGVQLSIDDFGTGYLSFDYLKRLPIEFLKINLGLNKSIMDDQDALALVESVIAMAKILKKRVIIKGVETEKQLNLIRQSGCHMVQGYHISAPLPARQFAFFVRQYQAEQDGLVRTA